MRNEANSTKLEQTHRPKIKVQRSKIKAQSRNGFWLAAMMIVLAGALALRVPRLDLRPMHTDEAVHAVKFNTLRETGRYVYDPQEYHGPTIYYPALLIAKVRGQSTFAQVDETTLRLVTALFGAALVIVIWGLRDGLSTAAVWWAALLTALSPAFVFYARYYIQETLLTFFTAGTIVAGWKYFRSGHTVWALLAGACLGLMHATKETWIIHATCMLLGVLTTVLWTAWIDKHHIDWRTHIHPQAKLRALLLGATVSALLFSAFFTNPRGPLDSVLAYTTYLNRAGETDIHQHPWYYYLQLLLWSKSGPLLWSEALIFVLGTAGMIFALWKGGVGSAHLSLVRFLTFYTLAMTLIYSLIPYKTPWCSLGFWHGFILMAGFGASTLLKVLRRPWLQVPVGFALLALSAQLGRQAWAASLNERFVADRRNPYVYAHSTRDVVRLGEQIEQLAALHPDRRKMLIAVIGKDYWPLPWYLRAMQRVGYFSVGQLDGQPQQLRAPVIISSPEASEKVLSTLGPDYEKRYVIESYGLRPAVVISVFVERKLWDVYLKKQLNS
jgi:uncharacterized protein (TIGR03663 family)